MLTWIRDKLSRRSTVSRPSVCLSEKSETNTSCPSQELTTAMYAEENHPRDTRTTLHIIYDFDVWIIKVEHSLTILELTNMAIVNFIESKNYEQLTSKYKLILLGSNLVLNPVDTILVTSLNNYDEILLVTRKSIGISAPVKLTIEDKKGPSKEEVMAATAHLIKKNSILLVPSFDCQESFQSEIRKVLFSLVEASAKILAQSPDAKIVFDRIATRISAKTKKEIDKNAIKYLKDLGFTEAQAKYALRLKRNRQIEAMEWLLDNSQRVKEEPDEIEEVASTSAVDASSTITNDDPLHTINKLLKDIQDFYFKHFEPNPKALEVLKNMGFNQDDVIEALRFSSNNQVTACERLCGEKDPLVTQPEAGLDPNGTLYKALMANPAIQLGMHNPKIMLAFLSILENPSSANLWLNDVDTAPVLGQVFKTYHSEKHIMVVNQQMELIKKREESS